MAAYFDALLRYFEFSGRSSRRQLWYFWLTTAAVCGAAGALDLFGMSWQANPVQPGFFLTFAIIFHFVPNVTLTVRRLHDIGRSGWWWWLSCVPFGDLVLFVWTGFFASESGENHYGEQERGGRRQASSVVNYERALRRPGTGGSTHRHLVRWAAALHLKHAGRAARSVLRVITHPSMRVGA